MKTRMHISIILEKLVSSFIFIVAIAFYIITQMLGDFSSEEIENTAQTLFSIGFGIYAIGIIVVIILLMIFTFVFWIMWKNTYLSFNNDSLIIERGKLFKKITTIHLVDIATINIKRNILEKILGTSNIKIDLNTNNETYNGKLVFKETKATEIKNEILKRMGKDIVLETKDIESDIIYTPKDVFRHMLLSTNLISILLLVLIYLGIVAGIMSESKPIGILFGILPLLIIIMPLALSLIKSYLGYYNFKCIRDEDNIKLSYGALTTYKYSIPLQKINAIIIHQTLQARILGYYLFEVVNAGIGEEKEEKTIISLYVNEKTKIQILDEIIPEYKNEIILKSGDKNVLKHYLCSKIFWIILSIVLSLFTNFVSLILIPFLILVAYMQYKTRKIGSDDNMIVIANGVVNKKTIITKYSNIELIQSNQKVFSKLFNSRSLQINVVGSNMNNIFVSGLFNKQIIKNIVDIY